MNAEILEALSRAFMTGYDLGRNHGVTLGIWIGLAAASLLQGLVRLGALLWAWYKGRDQRASIAAARTDFNEFERQQTESKK